MQYRAEIDGLRALAVLPVILFHAGFEWFSGGFVGVDVFFVISGYLITTILIEDIENKRFSIVNFYERRARRILPALFFVMLVCIPFAWMWMLPGQMKDFSQSLIAVSLFASNILFWKESSYFAEAAEEKPLLHTWSLAVEEQYYVLFPIFLILAWRFGKNRVFWMIVVMAAISLLLSEWGWRNNATANFYLAPTRAWELFAGSIAAFIIQKNGVQKNNFLSLIGLAAIIFSIFFYDEATPFPSVYALVPVLGVVLLVLYADKETFSAKLLSTKGFVGIGLISYSAYLWHQPLFAFARIRSLEHPSASLMIALTLASIALAYLSWRHIEKPFRNKVKVNSLNVFITFAVVISSFLSIGFLGHYENGFKSRFSDYATILDAKNNIELEEECFLADAAKFNSNCTINGENFVMRNDFKSILLIGDSHAASLFPELRKSLNPRVKVDLMSYGRCIPLVETNLLTSLSKKGLSPYVRRHITSRCVSIKADFNRHLTQSNYDLIVVLVHYNNWLSGFQSNGFMQYEELLRSSLPNILGENNVVILGPLPIWQPDVPKIALSIAQFGSVPEYVSNGLYSDTFRVNSLVKNIAHDNEYQFISLLDKGCFNKKCKLGSYINDEFYPFAYDYGHLTKYGGEFYSKSIESTILDLLQVNNAQ